MEYLLAFLVGCAAGLYRGGIFGHKKEEFFAKIKPAWLGRFLHEFTDGKIINALMFGVFAVLAHEVIYVGFEDGYPAYVLTGGALALFAYAFAMMLRGSAPGWGDYIGAIMGHRKGLALIPAGKTIESYPQISQEYQLYKPLQEVEYIDRMIEGLKDRPVLWGIAGLSLRLGEWGLFLGAPPLSFWPILAGLAAGPVCWIATKINRKYAWKIFEAVSMGLFWVSILL